MNNIEELLQQYASGSREFIGADLAEANLSGVNLAKINLSRANLNVANLSGSNLCEAILTQANFNVARLSGANLTRANLTGAVMNVANLSRADLKEAKLTRAALIKAELVLADLSGVDLRQADMNGANLKEARLRQANLDGANASNADLRSASLTGASLNQIALNGADLEEADLRGVDLANADLKQANLFKADLRGADLSGANLRWANLSHALLNNANLNGAKLSGADLNNADLRNATLLDASLIYADLNSAILIGVDWLGADLTGATLTGARLHHVSRFGIKTDGIICEWVDLSPEGDLTQQYRLYENEHKKFFKQTPPAVRVVVDMPLDQDANFSLAMVYRQLAACYPEFLVQPPSVEVGRRRTVLTFRIDRDTELLSTAYVAIFPFRDSEVAQRNIVNLVKLIWRRGDNELSLKERDRFKQLHEDLKKLIRRGQNLNLSTADVGFFEARTEMLVVNSGDQSMTLYHHPMFGKKMIGTGALTAAEVKATQPELPPLRAILDFAKGFYYLEN